MVDVAAILFYLYAAFGSVTLGYLLLRFSFPVVRSLGVEEKLGVSAVTGFVLAALSLLLDFLVSGEGVFQARGSFFPIAFFVFLFSLLALKFYAASRKRNFITVGLPVPAVLNVPSGAPASSKAEHAAPEARQGELQGTALKTGAGEEQKTTGYLKALAEVRKAEHRKAVEGTAFAIISEVKKHPVKEGPEDAREQGKPLEKKGGGGLFGGVKERVAGLQSAAAAFFHPAAKRLVGETNPLEKSFAGKEQRTDSGLPSFRERPAPAGKVGGTPGEWRSAGISRGKRALDEGASRDLQGEAGPADNAERAGWRAKREELKRSLEGKPGEEALEGQPARQEKTPLEKDSPKEEKKEEDVGPVRGGEEAAADARETAGLNSVEGEGVTGSGGNAGERHSLKEGAVNAVEKPGLDKVGRKEKTDARKSGGLLEVGLGAEGALQGASARRAGEGGESVGKEKKLEKLAEEVKFELQEKPEQKLQAPVVSSDERLKKEELEKAWETETELVLSDIVQQAKHEAQEAGEPEVPREERVVHRRYMLKKRGREERAVNVFADEKAASKENFDSLVGEVYSQLDSTKTKGGLAEGLSVNAPPSRRERRKWRKKEGEPVHEEAAAAPLSFEDILGEKKEEKKGAEAGGGLGGSGADARPGAAKSEGLFSQLQGIAGGEKAAGKEKEPTAKSKVELVKMQAEKGMGCPTCKAKSSKVIFCPYCGSGMCTNCSPKIVPTKDHITYSCPKCGEDVEVQKKR